MPDDNVIGGFSNEGVESYRRLRETADRLPPGFLGRPRYHAETPADPGPWGQLVLTPAGGIPAMWEETTGTGTHGDTAPGTGTGSQGDAGDRPGYALCDAYQLFYVTQGGGELTHPRVEPTGFQIRVYNPSFTAVGAGVFLVAKRDPWGDWWADRTGGADSTFLINLTAKRYDLTDRPVYGGWTVVDNGNGTFSRGAQIPGDVYHLQTTDLPVWLRGDPGTAAESLIPPETVVRARAGADGSYSLVDQDPRVDIVKKRTPTVTKTIGGVTYTVGDLYRLDQDTHTLVRVKRAYILDVSGL